MTTSAPSDRAETETEPIVDSTTSGVSMRAVAQMAVFAALIGALGLMGAIAVPGLVPMTAQTLGVMLAGAVLGPWRGSASVALLLMVVALGMPLLSGGRGGLGVFVGPSAGYLIGWIVGAMVVGLVVHGVRGRPSLTWPRVLAGAALGGIGVIYLCGIPVQSVVTGLDLGQTMLTSLAFLPGDIIKVAVTVVVTMALWRAYPRAFQS
ncbi:MULTISPECIES: biotin transporter BioY [unclassified Nesterenkonia]|uniref:biotin transporter BioY n=1 Tax=unclassified Nesterenkonia TaxID=2629769 RepID=UPI001F4D1CB2|nr:MULTISPECIES: biotin transporter BioY [unclassified Nesterenkonia]MCH8559244.1 biotin transporter BioY [Nesterenkonia sp. DZ6]MCH8571589.1 biotin transporter BioY [Nesterenkonia sp. AY15]